MTGLSGLLADALLVFSILCARPASVPVWQSRLLIQEGLLGCSLLARMVTPALGGPPATLPLAGLLAVLAEMGCLFASRRNLAMRASPLFARPIWPVFAALVAAWLAIRLLPEPIMASGAREILSASVGIVLASLVGALAARDPRARIAALLLAGNGVLLGTCMVAGPGWPSLMAILPLQTLGLIAFCAWPARGLR